MVVAGARFELASTTPYFVRTVRLKVSNMSHRKVALEDDFVNKDILPIKAHRGAFPVYRPLCHGPRFNATLRAKEWLLW